MVTLRDWEMPQAAVTRHARCRAGGFNVVDASASGFTLDGLDEPLLVTRLTRWSATTTWNATSFRDWLSPLLFGSPRRADDVDNMERTTHIVSWNFSAGGVHRVHRANAQLPQEPADWEPAAYFRRWNHRAADGVSFSEDNANIFDPFFSCEAARLNTAGVPTPKWLRERCESRHVSFGAVGTSHGFHRHEAAWHGLVAGRKSWYIVQPEATDEAPPETPFGYKFEPSLVEQNSMCGYAPRADAWARAHMRTCVQHAGEVVIVPQGWWHGTCALAKFTAGSGGLISPSVRETRPEGRVEL